MNTKFWGPPGWRFLHTTTFNYPPIIDTANNSDHFNLPDDIKNMFYGLQKTLPCKYCRQSFKQFMAELPIEPFLGSRKSLTYWLYAIHNKVNHKLRTQEWDLFVNKVNEILRSQNMENITTNSQKKQESCSASLANVGAAGGSKGGSKGGSIFGDLLEPYTGEKVIEDNKTNAEDLDTAFFTRVNELKDDILFTEPDPLYEDVCKFYDSQRAGCTASKDKIASCRL